MVTSVVTSKGQITIPKAVRDTLGLHTGDRVEFVVQGPEGAVMKPMTRSVDEVFGMLHRPGGPVLSVEDMDRAIGEGTRGKKR
jgi:antitoxin PrlF